MEIKLKTEKRERAEKLPKDQVAAIIYGSGSENQLLKMKGNDFLKVYGVAGVSNLIELELDGKKNNVIVKEIQKHPVKNNIIHVDFYQVNMKKVIVAEIPFHFIGESKAVKEQGGLLLKGIDYLSVECLPGDLLDHIDIDISLITKIGQSLRVEDLKLPASLKVLANPSDSIVTVAEQREEAVVEPEKVVEVVPEKDKKEIVEDKKEVVKK